MSYVPVPYIPPVHTNSGSTSDNDQIPTLSEFAVLFENDEEAKFAIKSLLCRKSGTCDKETVALIEKRYDDNHPHPILEASECLLGALSFIILVVSAIFAVFTLFMKKMDYFDK